jgi:hypothetical protein
MQTMTFLVKVKVPETRTVENVLLDLKTSIAFGSPEIIPQSVYTEISESPFIVLPDPEGGYRRIEISRDETVIRRPEDETLPQE